MPLFKIFFAVTISFQDLHIIGRQKKEKEVKRCLDRGIA